MKVDPATRSTSEPNPSPGKIDRRRVVAGATVAGAAAVAAGLLHRGAVTPAVADASKPMPEQGDGYRLTPHVLRYYETTRS
jgi:hypothetical protein